MCVVVSELDKEWFWSLVMFVNDFIVFGNLENFTQQWERDLETLYYARHNDGNGRGGGVCPFYAFGDAGSLESTLYTNRYR